MNAFAISGFILGFTCLFLGALILKASTNKIHLIFALQNLSIAIWGFGCGFVGLSNTAENAYFWWSVAHVGGFFIIAFLFHHALLISKLQRRFLLYTAYALSVFLPILFFTKTIGLKMRYVFSALYYPQPINLVYPMYGFAWIGIGIYTTVLMIKLYRKTDIVSLKIYAIAYAFAIWGGGSYFLPVYGIEFYYPYGNVILPLYCIVMTYAILRHQLLDIEIIIRKTLVFAGLLASVFAMLILPTLLIQEYIFRTASFTGRMIGLAISGIIIILSMRRIENFLINITDKYLFQKRYDYKELLKTFTAEVLTVLELDRLVNLTVDKMTDIVKINSSAVLLLDEEKQQFEVLASHNIKDPSVTLIRPDGIVTFMEQTHGYLLIKDMREKKIFIPDSIQEIINKLNAELIIPMVLHEKVMGVLSLGKKKSDEDYTQDDLDILLPLARTLAIAISNAQLFKTLKKTQADAAEKERMATIGTLAAGMAHEIRNPITTIRVFSEYLPDKLSEPEFILKYKNTVLKEVDKVDHIIQTMVDFSGDDVPGDAERVSLNEAISESINLLELDKDIAKRINFINTIPLSLPKIQVNRKELDEILLNLCQNAIHAIADKGTIDFNAVIVENKVSLFVKDNGCGMQEEVLKNIFNPFFTTKSTGFGLGLFIVNELMSRNGGKIAVESEAGVGTTFRLEFLM